jgi:hypothetical protein
MTLVQSIEAAAPSNSTALELLSMTRQDTDGLICSEGIIGWVEAALMRGPLPEDDLQWLENELNTVGPEYQKRRTAAVIGLLLAGNIERFARAKRYDGKLLDVEATPGLTRDDTYLRRLLPRWEELTHALGNEQEVLDRFNINPERTLRAIHTGIAGADRLFALLMDRVPGAQHVHNSVLIAALSAMAPQSKHMRDLVASLLLSPFRGSTLGDHWAELRAGEFFAEYFRGDQELREKVIGAFKANPHNSAAAAALAELLLREHDPEVGTLLAEIVSGRRYGLGAHFKLIAALSSPDGIIESLEELLTKNIEPHEWSLPYWVPSLVRRIKIDSELQERMHAALCKADSISLKLNLCSLLSRGGGPADKLKQYAVEELRTLEANSIPAIGFDLTRYGHQPLFQILSDLAA